jgi:LPXTG-motif cell wall-anchored protein
MSEALVYTVREASIRGYESSVREATSGDAASSWMPVSNLASGGTYLLVSGNHALSVDSGGLAWTDVSSLLDSGDAADNAQLWTYSDSKLRNGNGKYLYMSRSGLSYFFTAGTSGTNISYTNNYLRASTGFSYRYFADIGNNGSASASSGTSGATQFAVYERSTNGGTWGEAHYIVTNTKLPASVAFHFVKYAVGSNKNPTLLAGAQLELYRVSETGEKIPGTDQTGTLVRSWITENADGENGGFRIEELYSGTYYLLETGTPEGFLGLGAPIVFTVEAETGQVTVISAPYALSFENGPDVVFPIYNQATYELPRTGGVGTQVYTVAGLLLVTISIALLVYNRRKRRREGYDSF